MTTPLTTHLQTVHPTLFHHATTTPFLHAAGTGTLPKPLRSTWLSQDRLYAHAYIRFIGALLAKVVIPQHNPSPAKPAAKTVEARAVDVLIDALVNIKQEIQGFEDIARRYGLDVEKLPDNGDKDEEDDDNGGDPDKLVFGPTPITHAYVDLFMSASSPGATLLEGLAVLWATEFSYLRAWQYAASLSSSTSTQQGGGGGGGGADDADGGALREHFIPSWTSPEFEAFVKRIAGVVDDLAMDVKGFEQREDLLRRCRVWWRQVLWLERGFGRRFSLALDVERPSSVNTDRG